MRLPIRASSKNIRRRSPSRACCGKSRLMATRRSKPPWPEATASMTCAIPPLATVRTVALTLAASRSGMLTQTFVEIVFESGRAGRFPYFICRRGSASTSISVDVQKLMTND